MNSKFKFKFVNGAKADIKDAEMLFRDLKIRDPLIQHLWAHQADIIRSYHKDINNKDIALELPTGTGKTLIGLLIAEWRRIQMGERVLYICPTRQLAQQVGEKSINYGIPAHVLVGKQNQYNPIHFSDFALSKALAITTYSGIFNSNPKLNNPDLIILDDAHAGDNYIAKMWTLNIQRAEHREVYDLVLKLFEQDLSESITMVLKDDSIEVINKQNVDLLPGPKLINKTTDLSSLLDLYAKNYENLQYTWSTIRDNLQSCSIYFSWSEIIIRPWIPPTLTHLPFANAKQRIYMSATLGSGGELERITGIKKIHRIPVPQGWDKQSNGRRLFIFPDRSFNLNEYEKWLASIISISDRILVLTPNTFFLKNMEELISKHQLHHKILYSRDIEDSLLPFTEADKAILLLTNRYDGIDLPGDSCRVLFVYGPPAAVNLQEKFLLQKLNLNVLFYDTIRTRITQAAGRCTRSSTDYALVVMVGEKLFDYCMRREIRELLHPEFRAELEFGLDNSETGELDSLTSLVDIFLKKNEEWDRAEGDIIQRRDLIKPKITSDHIDILLEASEIEVNYQYALWRQNYEEALNLAKQIIDKLAGPTLSGYRALWNYYAGCSAYCIFKEVNNEDMRRIAMDYFNNASNAVRTVHWFARLSAEIGSEAPLKFDASFLPLFSAENINDLLILLGTVGYKFERVIQEIGYNIDSSEANKFDVGLTELGKMLGFEANKPVGQGVPDSVWTMGSHYAILFECKSNETPEGVISISTCRQAQGHKRWFLNNAENQKYSEVLTVISSPRNKIDDDILPHADDLFYVNISEFRGLFKQARLLLQLLRSKHLNVERDQIVQIIIDEYSKAKLDPLSIITRLKSQKVDKLSKL